MFVGLLLLVIGVAGAFQAPSSFSRKRYDGYKVYTVTPRTISTLHVLHEMMLKDIHVDFWKEPSRLNHEVEFMVAPEHQIGVVTKLRRADIDFSVKLDDVQSILTPMWNDIDKRRAISPEPYVFDLNEYNTLTDINAWLVDVAANCPGSIKCEVYSLGNSYEGRPINALRIYKDGSNRVNYYIEANTHAREWITSATIVNIINNLATQGDADATRLTDLYDWTLVPVVNVDGYEFSWADDRLWRKNRRPVGTACIGTDINRNYDWSWGEDGASAVPCSETYCGPSPASEPETQVIAAELVRLGPTTVAMVTLHSYGNMWMFPWGNTVNYEGRVCERASDHDELMRVADITANAIEATYSTTWGRGNSCEVIYATSGGTNDYAKGAAGIKYAYVPELRGNSFVVPANQIKMSYDEVWNGIVAMVNAIGA